MRFRVHRKVIEFRSEPKGRLYRMLLDQAAKTCPAFLLVRRPAEPLSPSGDDVQKRLSAFLISEKQSSGWPGTQLLGHEATVFKYEFRPDSLKILTRSASRLFQWRQPELPEDLCLLRQDGSPWLVSIAHESDAYLELSGDEERQLSAEMPELRALLT